MPIVRNTAARWILLGLGIVSLITGAAGVFLPLLPTTPFVLLSAWCFLRSSPRAHAWLYSHPRFSKPLRDWQERGAISRRSKILALSTIALSLLVIWLTLPILGVKIGVTVVILAVSVFIASRPER